MTEPTLTLRALLADYQAKHKLSTLEMCVLLDIDRGTWQSWSTGQAFPARTIQAPNPQLQELRAILNLSPGQMDEARELHRLASLSQWRTRDALREEILWFLNERAVTATDISNFFGRNKKSAELKQALRELVEEGLLTIEKLRPAGGKGAPIRRYSLCKDSRQR